MGLGVEILEMNTERRKFETNWVVSTKIGLLK